MKLQDIFDQLTAGEFSQLSIGGADKGVINESNFKLVIAHINLGLASLYRRFTLKEGKLVLSLQNAQTLYPLKSEYALTNRHSHQPVRTILDSADMPFKDDIIKIERVLTALGQEMPLNDVGDRLSCMTPNMNTLVVPTVLATQSSETPDWLRTNRLTVAYRAAHPILSVPLGFFDPCRVSIELPYSHLEALLFFIAARAEAPIGLSNEFNASNTYAAKYERACQELMAVNVRVDEFGGNNKLRQKGFC